MESLAWILLWVMVFGGGYLAFLLMGKRALSRHPSKQEEVEPFAEWKRLAAESRKRKDQDLADWTQQFNEILQKTCTHDYDPENLQRKKWWVCVLCDYEKPWHFVGGCSCITTEDSSLTDRAPRKALYHRSGVCNVHGRPRLIAYNRDKKPVRDSAEQSWDALDRKIKYLEQTYDLPSTKYKRLAKKLD